MITAARYCLAVTVLFLLGCLLVLAVVGDADAGVPCRVQVRHHAVYHAPVYVPQAINFFVGAPVRLEAEVTKALRNDPDFEAFQRFRQYKQLENGLPADAASEPANNGQSYTPNHTSSVVTSKCARCHSGATPKGGLTLDGTGGPLDAATSLKAMQMVRDGQMPPKGGLTPDEAGALFSELLDLVQPVE